MIDVGTRKFMFKINLMRYTFSNQTGLLFNCTTWSKINLIRRQF